MWHDIVNFLMQPFWIQINRITVLIVCGYAILGGTWRERFAGTTYMAAFLLPTLFAFVWSNRIAVPLLLISDILCLPGFLTVNRKSPYAWTRWALALQLLSTAGDVADMLIYGERRPPIYIISEAVITYGILAALLTGTISAQIRRYRQRPKDASM